MSDKKCPKCNSNLGRVGIVRIKENQRFDFKGTNWFCRSPKCHYEVDTK